MLTRRWVVMGSEELGLPVATDEDVFVALLEVAREQGFSGRDVFFTQSDLMRRMGWPHKGESMERLKRALTRLISTTIVCENVIWDNTWVVKYYPLGEGAGGGGGQGLGSRRG